MLIRIKKGSGGIEEYLKEGRKQGRHKTRDELDERVILRGDLNTLSLAINYAQTAKKWKSNYTHISLAFTHENSDITPETMTDIVNEVVAHFFHLYNNNEICAYAEAHLPKFQHELNASTGEKHQRLPHIHLVVAHLNAQTGKQLRMLPFTTEADRAFQSYLCARYDLIDPIDRLRSGETTITKKDFIARLKSNDEGVTKKSSMRLTRELLAELLDTATSVQDIQQRLDNAKGIDSVRFVSTAKNRYFKVSINNKTVNLRGKLFEKVAALCAATPLKSAPVPAPKRKTEQENVRLLELYKAKHRANQYQKKTPQQTYASQYQRQQKWLDTREKEQKQFYVFYRSHISQELIAGFSFWESLNERYLINRAEGIKIYDKGDRIVVDASNPAFLTKAIRIALTQAQAKGWDIDNLTVNGNDAFKSAVKQEIKHILLDQQRHQSPAIALTPIVAVPVKNIYTDNLSQQLLKQAEDIEQQSLSKERVNTLKSALNAEKVLNFASENLGVLNEHFQITADNKIQDLRTTRKPQNVIDFMFKTCHLTFADSLVQLEQLYEKQQQEEEAEEEDNSMGMR
ncbi:MAG: hypothetical protein NTV00_17165 [Methylococcales bacterium]|nr:hypothetical protein [Methylococcales bacterium]